jgi:hypothetical protein
MSFIQALPALASAAASIFSSLKGGSGNKKISNFDKNQQKFFNQYSQNALGNLGGQQNVMGLLQSMLDPNSEFFKNFENQQMTQFNEQTLPNIAERFAGGASGGALSSSGFGQALGGAASGLQSNLAAGKNDMIMKALQQLLGQYNQQANTVLGAKPFDLQDQGGGFGGGFAQGLANISPGILQQLFSSLGGGGGNKFPLTQGYDTMFRQQGVF